jgi:hypothetical protein
LKAPRKLTIGQCIDQGDTTMHVWCAASPQPGRRCGRHADIGLDEAAARFGHDTHLDQIPFRCSACGARFVDVTASRPYAGARQPWT